MIRPTRDRQREPGYQKKTGHQKAGAAVPTGGTTTRKPRKPDGLDGASERLWVRGQDLNL